MVMLYHYGKEHVLTGMQYRCYLYVFRQRLVQEYEKTGELLVELGSDQTSLHNPYGGGYYPVQLSFDEGRECLETDPKRFKELVQERYVHVGHHMIITWLFLSIVLDYKLMRSTN